MEPEVLRPITVTERVVRLGIADREPLPYAIVPFDVPAGARSLRISLRYDGAASSSDADDGNLVDLGLLAPGPTGVAGATFRGWSGSERGDVGVGETLATPGYRAGPIAPGTWHVLLGLYRIVPGGCEARVRFEVMPDEAAIPDGVPARPAPGLRHGLDAEPASRSPAPGTSRWIPVDLHAHTVHSDGTETDGALAARAGAVGLEALFVTDHNTDAHLGDLAVDRGSELPALLPGEEVTTYGGHLNALGIQEWVEFRYADAAGLAVAIDEIHAQGGLASVNHPTSAELPWLHGAGLDIDCVEVWNGPWSPEDDAALDWWEGLATSGRTTTAVGGSDTHGAGPGEQPVGVPTTWVRARGTGLEDLLDGIGAGRVVLTRDSGTPPPDLWLEAGDRHATVGESLHPDAGQRIVARWAIGFPGEGRTVAPPPSLRIRLIVDGVIRHDVVATDVAGPGWTIPAGERPGRVRLEVRDERGELVAATNPVHVKGWNG
jgi:predicted metal-dependent phosphoesterase TrpH